MLQPLNPHDATEILHATTKTWQINHQLVWLCTLAYYVKWFLYWDHFNMSFPYNLHYIHIYWKKNMLCCCLVTKLSPALCGSMDCSLSGSSVHGIFQAIVLEWIAFSFSRGSSQGIELESPAWKADSLSLSHRGSPKIFIQYFTGSLCIKNIQWGQYFMLNRGYIFHVM